MDLGLILAVIAALAVGALIGWLVAARNSAGAAQTAENLRMQGTDEDADTTEMHAGSDQPIAHLLHQIFRQRRAGHPTGYPICNLL